MKKALLSYAVFAIIGIQGRGNCQIGPVGQQFCKVAVFSCNEGFDFDEMLSYTTQSV